MKINFKKKISRSIRDDIGNKNGYTGFENDQCCECLGILYNRSFPRNIDVDKNFEIEHVKYMCNHVNGCDSDYALIHLIVSLIYTVEA